MKILLDALKNTPILPIVVLHKVEHAIPIANALLEGGIKTVEIALRTPCALEAIEEISKNVPNIIVGAGTVKSLADLHDAYTAGAQFAVSPGVSMGLIQAAKNGGMPFIPGISTTTEAMQALEYGFTHLKLFPAHILDTANLLNIWQNILPEIVFCPSGGISQSNIRQYLAYKNVFAVGGSFLCPEALLQQKDYAAISQIAQQSIQLGTKFNFKYEKC